MSRLVWVGVGAVGGIYSYRKGERAVAALQAQEALRVVKVVTAVGRRPQSASMAMHPASGGHARSMAPVVPTGLRVGRFRITRTDEPAPLTGSEPVDPSAGRLHALQPHPADDGRSNDVVDISEAARRGRRPGVAPRRRAR